jgi:hypothetical protein
MKHNAKLMMLKPFDTCEIIYQVMENIFFMNHKFL